MNSQEPDKPKIIISNYRGNKEDLPEGIVLNEGHELGSPPRVCLTPEVIDSPEEIAFTKKFYFEQMEATYRLEISRIAKDDSPSMSVEDVLKEFPEKAIADLKKILNDPDTCENARANSASTLVVLNCEEGATFLTNCLQADSPSLVLAALGKLQRDSLNVSLSSPKHIKNLLALLDSDDEKVVIAAINTCHYRRIQEGEKRITEILEEKPFDAPVDIVAAVARLATTAHAAELCVQYLLKSNPSKLDRSTRRIVGPLLKNENPAVVEAAHKPLHDFLVALDNKQYESQITHLITLNAGLDSLPTLLDILHNAKDFYSRSYAIDALIRLQPEKTIETLLDFTIHSNLKNNAVKKLAEYAKESDFDQVAPAILSVIKQSNLQISEQVAHLFLFKLGQQGIQAIKEHFTLLDKKAELLTNCVMNGTGLLAVLDEMASAGIIHSSPEAIIKKMEDFEKERSNELDLANPKQFESIFYHDNIFTIVIRGYKSPTRHDNIIKEFADNSAGKFKPEYPIQLWYRKNKDDYNAPFTIQFIYKDRVYRNYAENYGRWCDAEAISSLLNLALETSGHKERYIPLALYDDVAHCYVFTIPEAFYPFAKKYNIPILEDETTPMHKSDDLVKRVLEEGL